MTSRTPKLTYRYFAVLFLVSCIGVCVISICDTHADDFDQNVSLMHPPTNGQFPPWFAILVNGKWGYIDSKGDVMIKPQFTLAQLIFSGKFAMARNPGRIGIGFIDRKGNWVLSPVYDDARPFSEGLAAIAVNGKWGYIDESGKTIIPTTYDSASFFLNGIARVGIETWRSALTKRFSDGGKSCKWTYIDKRGDKVSRELAKLKRSVPPNQTIEIKRIDGKVLIVGAGNSDIQLTDSITDARSFQKGMAAVRINGKWGFIDITGKMAIQNQFELVEDFTSSVVAAKENGKWGLIDQNGNWIVKPEFDVSYGISHGLWRIGLNQKVGYLDLKGNWVWKATK